MGRLIDETLLQETLAKIPMEERTFRKAVETVEELPTVEAIPKVDYENRLKADMVAMLTEIQLEFEEKERHYQDEFLKPNNVAHESAMGGRMFGCGECKELIQQKINALNAESEHNE